MINSVSMNMDDPNYLTHAQTVSKFPVSASFFSEKSNPTMVSVKRSKWKESYLRVKSCLLRLFIKYWFLLGLGVAILLSWKFPNVARRGGYLRAEWTIKWGNYQSNDSFLSLLFFPFLRIASFFFFVPP
ncbi:uncharacterized protein BYT42DRAFT_190728 [Radiomyces spectabilis]|uniref:uncharacterized protein n=1 Tax=Radiomyces spectabilis TaxID=64574 RepID=UPI002220254F|nr:uncharacterized protein BYT42DRAFT_190728 [Radiomyces spectabilis]KAI8391336.1 hypothetical protein BYT42DRAFT_190728 [Radiomyces spectabilis]